MKNRLSSRRFRSIATPTVLGVAVAVSLTLAASPSLLRAQISLATVVDQAQRSSSAVKLAQADMVKAEAALAQTRDAYIPSLTVGSTVGYSRGFPTGQPSIANASAQSLAYSSSQVQYLKAARAGVESASLNLKDAREQVALESSTAYLELDTVNRELQAARVQATYADRLVEIERQRSDAGVDPLSELLQARLAAAQLNLKLIHLESRAKNLASQLASLTGLPAASIATDPASIPQIPAIAAPAAEPFNAGILASQAMAHSKQFEARGDALAAGWRPQIAFGAQYNLDSDALNNYSTYYKNFTPNNISFGFSILVPIFDLSHKAKARQTAAEALRATVEAEQAQRQNDVQIASLTGSLRELDSLAEIASLKQQIAAEQLKAVQTQLELGNGSGAEPGSTPQLSPKAEQQARIDLSQKAIDALDAGFDLSKARLGLLRALGHIEDWLQQVHAQEPGNPPK